MLHLGSASVPVHVRPLDAGHARLSLLHPLPAQPGDRAILRDPGRQSVAAGVLVLDADPPPLRRRGAAARRAGDLASHTGRPDLQTEVRRRGAVRRADLPVLGLDADVAVAFGVEQVGEWLVDEKTWAHWVSAMEQAVREHAQAAPLDPAMPLEAARRAVGVPDTRLVLPLATAAGLEVTDGRVRLPGAGPPWARPRRRCGSWSPGCGDPVPRARA